MLIRLLILISTVVVFTVTGQTISLTGTVVDSQTSAALSGATVKLVEYPQVVTTTAANGSFTLSGTATVVQPFAVQEHGAEEIILDGNSMLINGVHGSTTVSVDVFSSNGVRISHTVSPISNGAGRFDNLWQIPGLYIVNISAGGKKYSAMSIGTGRHVLSIASASSYALAKTAATYTLQISASGYLSKSLTLSSMSGSAGTIKMAPYQQQTGVWTCITPPGMTMDYNFTGNGNYGAQGVATDPVHPNVMYICACYQGVWKSTDYGKTFIKVNTGTNGSLIDGGRPWAMAIAPDGSYLMTVAGYGQGGIFKSTDGGVNWTHTWVGSQSANDVYTIAISPYNKNHVILTSHWSGDEEIYESVDAGQTWTDNGSAGKPGHCGYVDFLFSDSVIMITGDGDNAEYGGTARGVRSKSTWPWTWSWTKVNEQQHYHGSHQAFIDTVNKVIFNPGAFGIYRSTDVGLSWTACSEVLPNTYANSNCMIGTTTTLYATESYASSTGYSPNLQHANRVPGTSWTIDTAPAAMNNGASRYAVTNDGTHNIIVSANWNAGFWRFVEP